MEVIKNIVEGWTILKIVGECDAYSSIVLNQSMEDALGVDDLKALIVDCTELSYISSPGLGVFTSIIDDCEDSGIALILFGMTDSVEKVFKIMGLNDLLTIVDNQDNAIAYASNLQY